MKTAEEVINPLILVNKNYISREDRVIIYEAMKRYAEQFIDAAADIVEEYKPLSQLYDSMPIDDDLKEDIVSLKDQLK